MNLTNENLFSQSYTNIKNFLNGISGLDPRSRFKANWIHASMPNVNKKGFDGYPFIVLTVNVSEEKKSFDSSISEKIFRCLIAVYSDDPGQVDAISDLIRSNLNDIDFQVKELSNSPMAWNLDLNGKKISFRNIGIMGRSRI